MPVEVLCGSCHSKLRVPETALGRKVKCPKCNSVFEARAKEPEVAEVEEVEEEKVQATPRKRRQEVDEDEDRPAKKRPRDEDEDEDEDRPRNKKKGRRDDEDEEDDKPSKKRRRDEDEDEDEDDRPRSKKGRRDEDEDEEDEEDRPSKRRAKKAKGGKGLIIGLAAGGGGLLLIGIILLLVFMMGGGSDANCTTANWNQLKQGMTRADVEKILGPGHELTAKDVETLYGGTPKQAELMFAVGLAKMAGVTLLYWKNGNFSIQLEFSKEGKAVAGFSQMKKDNGFTQKGLGMTW